MMNKRGLEFKSSFFALVTIALVVTAVGIIYTEWGTHYNSGIVYDLGEYNKMTSLSAYSANYTSTLTPNTPDQGNDVEASTYRGVYGIIVNIFSPFRLVFGENGLLDSVSSRFGLPDYLKQGIIIMIIAAIAFTLVAIIFRQYRSNV